MVDSGATNRFVYSEVVQQVNATTVDVFAMRVTLADSSYIDFFIAIPLYLKICGNIQSSPSGMSKTVYVGCRALYCVLPNSTSDMILDMDWLHAINPLIDKTT